MEIGHNEIADALAKEIIEKSEITTTKIPHRDLRPKVHEHIHGRWDTQWREEKTNKLNEIKPKLQKRQPLHLSRQDCVIYTRLKIGHSKLTHRFLLAGEQKPVCEVCHKDKTIKHILTECNKYYEKRIKHYRCEKLKDIFDVVEPKKVLDFIKETGIYNQL